MKFRPAFLFALPASILALGPPAVEGSVDGADPGRTGGFGEMTCRECHWDNPLNEPAGQIRLDGVPESYTPGDQYVITVTLARPDLGRAGFQMSAREDGINMKSGSNAGTLQPADERTQTIEGGSRHVTYVQQTRRGAEPAAAGIATWALEWTAPDAGPVVFHVAGNAANADDSPLGDFIYVTEATSTPQP